MAAQQAFWRDSARVPRFFFVDALSAFPLVLFLLHIRQWTFILAILSIAFFAVLERFKFTTPIFFRWLRSCIAGRVRVARPAWRD